MRAGLSIGGRVAIGRLELTSLPDAVGILGELDELYRYVSDLAHDTAAATRRALVAELADTDTLVATGHYPGSGIGRIVRRDGRVAWEEVA